VYSKNGRIFFYIFHRRIQALIENVFLFSVPVELVRHIFFDDAFYKFTFYLLYLLAMIALHHPCAR